MGKKKRKKYDWGLTSSGDSALVALPVNSTKIKNRWKLHLLIIVLSFAAPKRILHLLFVFPMPGIIFSLKLLSNEKGARETALLFCREHTQTRKRFSLAWIARCAYVVMAPWKIRIRVKTFSVPGTPKKKKIFKERKERKRLDRGNFLA